jgi:hypothetical protein
MLQSLCSVKGLPARINEIAEPGKEAVALMTDDSDETVNAQLVTEGLARAAKQISVVHVLVTGIADGNAAVKLAAALNVAHEGTRNTGSRMWRYGDVGDDDSMTTQMLSRHCIRIISEQKLIYRN